MNDRIRQQLPDLTPRQLQILKLLQAGKPNKELSEELGIGLGTVKQHLVALFKKLKVKNRAMAVSLASDIQQEGGRSMSLKSEVLLDRRPCVVLSVSLPQDASPLAVRMMHGSMAAIASANDAIFLARSGNAGDVIFGIQHASEYVIAVALNTARSVHHDLMSIDASMAAQLRGCLTAGHAFASMHRFGGWTGEALASAAISTVRELLDTVAFGSFLIDAAARDLTVLSGIEGMPADSVDILFSDVDRLRCSANRPGYELIGRTAEMAVLTAGLDEAQRGTGMQFHIEGEMGMGKSRLCEELLQYCSSHSGSVSFYRCMPPILEQRCWDVTGEEHCSIEDIDKRLRAVSLHRPELVIVDDIHLLAAAQQTTLAEAIIVARQYGKLVVLAGRKVMRNQSCCPDETLVLRRMPPQSLQGLVRKAMGKSVVNDRASKVLSICSAAAGVPLFAIELARHQQAERQLPLTLQVAINARLDGLHLDRWLLREVARQAAGISTEEAMQKLGEDTAETKRQLNNSIAAGVLTLGSNEWISFSHPLLRQAVNDTITD